MSVRGTGTRGGPQALEAWARHHIDGYNHCSIKNMTSSWRNGLAFCALIHRFRPDLINYDDLDPNDIVGNCTLAFETAERQLGIPALLDPLDMLAMQVPDRLSVLTYVAQFYNTFKNMEARPFYNGSSNHHERKSPTAKRTLDIEDEALNEARKKLSGNSSPVMLRNNTSCSVCQNPVFISERILFNKKLYHRSCFRCFNCDHVLNPQTADISSDGHLFCLENTCFIEIQRRSREGKLNVVNSTSSTNAVTVNGESTEQRSQENENENRKIQLPNVSALKKSFEFAPSSISSSSGVSSEAPSLDSTNNQAISADDTTHDPKIRFDETVTVKSSTIEINSDNEIVSKEVDLKSGSDEVQELGKKELRESPSRISLHSEPSDSFVLRPDSSLISQIEQREEEETVRRNTAANEIVAAPELRTTSGIDVKSVEEKPNIYSESALPVVTRVERNAQKIDDSKKSQFLSGMLNEKDANANGSDNSDKLDVETIKVDTEEEPVVAQAEPEAHKSPKTEKVGPEVKLELEPGTEVIVKQELEVDEPEVRIKVEPMDSVESSADVSLPPMPLPSVTKSEMLPSPSASEKSPGPSPVPRRKSPAPSTTSTTSAISVAETPSTPSPAPTPRRSRGNNAKAKPPRPAPPSKASLTSIASRGSVPSAKELWKKDNYYPAELNPFESDEEVTTPTRPTSSSTIAATAAPVSAPGNPFEDDEDEEVSKPPSPKPSPRVRSARNQVNSIAEVRSRSHSRSKSKSPSRKSQTPTPSPSPRVPRPVSMPVQVSAPKPELKPYNPFEDEEDDENISGISTPEVIHRRQDSETSGTSSLSTPVPKARQSLPPSAPSSVEGSVRKSNKTKRAPLPPTMRNSSNFNGNITPPRSPKSILKQANQSPQSISPSPMSGSPKKIIPASPDLLRGLKSKPKKKRRAPPPRRRVEPLPEEAIKREMTDLIVKEKELERQGITLESNIRNLMEQQESTVEPEGGGVSTTEQQLDEMMVQLWNIVNEKNDILRRQTELEYLRRGHRLEEMQSELEFKIRVLMDTPVLERQDDYAQVEQTLLDELLKLVDERNEVVEWLDFNRKQDREDDALVSNTINSYSTSSSLQRQKQENAPTELVKDEKSKSMKKKKDKHKDKEIKEKEKDKEKDKQNSNKSTTGEKTEKEKKSKIKTLLFGKKKQKSLKNGHEPELEVQEQVNGSGSANTDNSVANANTELQK